MLKENTKVSYLRKIERSDPLFHPETRDWLRKQVRLFLNKAGHRGNFLGTESVDDYILKELRSEDFIEEKIDDDIEPNNHFKLTQKGKAYLREYGNILGRIELFFGKDYQFLGALLIGLFGGLIAIIFQK